MIDEEEESQLGEAAHVDVGDQALGGESQSLEKKIRLIYFRNIDKYNLNIMFNCRVSYG